MQQAQYLIDRKEMNIGQAIKLCRTQRGISQIELAKRSGCSVSHLSLLENGKRDATLTTIYKIADALKIPVGIIFFLGAEGKDLVGIDQELQGRLARLTLDMLNEPLS